jgi:ribosome-associated protein
MESASDTCARREAVIRAETLADALTGAIHEKQGFDIAILDLRSLVTYTDLFVICSARNRRQVQAIADEVRKVAKEQFAILPEGTEGMEAARWVLVDFGSVVVHVFDQPLRPFYDLDGLWRDAPRLPVPEGVAGADAESMFL